MTVTRTGGSSGPVTVNFATADGSAIGGVDFLPTSGTLSFEAGQTSQTIFLLLPNEDTPVVDGAKAFNLTLSMPGGGATLGATSTATITIPAVTTPPSIVDFLAIAAGGGEPRVFLFDPATGMKLGSFLAFESTFTNGVTVATGDVNGDGIDDVVVGSGAGGGPRARVFDGATVLGASPVVLADFFAYESTFRGGINVATGDVNGDGFDDVLIGSGNGGGPRVRVLDGETITSELQTPLADFFAYEESFRGGVNVSAGAFNNDSFAEIVTGAGFGGGPRVRILDGVTLSPLADYFAYDPSFRDGVLVGTGDVDGDTRDDIVTGSGLGGGPNVRAFSGIAQTSTVSFFAYEANLRGGVRVTTGDFGSDGTTEIITGSGIGGPATVFAFSSAGTQVGSFDSFDSTFTGGVFVG